MRGHWRVLVASYALADGVYWVAVKPRLRRALGVSRSSFAPLGAAALTPAAVLALSYPAVVGQAVAPRPH